MSHDRRRRPKCAQCRVPIELRPENAFFPFCSQRCQEIDLGRWLSEDYRLPIEGEDATERSLPPRGPDDDPAA